VDVDLQAPHRLEERGLAWPDPGARGERLASGSHVLAGLPDVLARPRLVPQEDPVTARLRGFLPDHRVGSCGKRSPREDPRRLPRSEELRRKVPRVEDLAHPQLDRAPDVGVTHRVAVHRRAGERRCRLPGSGRPGEEPPCGFAQR